MIPLRIEAAAVEPVGVPDLRAYLRFESDAGADEDGLLQALISAARASLEIETRRILIPAATGSPCPHGRRTGRCRCP